MDDTIKPKRTAEIDGLLKQFSRIDGPKGASKTYRDNWDRIFRRCAYCGETETIYIREDDLYLCQRHAG